MVHMYRNTLEKSFNVGTNLKCAFNWQNKLRTLIKMNGMHNFTRRFYEIFFDACTWPYAYMHVYV